MKKRCVRLLATLAILVVLLTGCEIGVIKAEFLHNANERTISTMFVARLLEVVDGEKVCYANVSRIDSDDINTCIDEICDLDTAKVYYDDADNRNPREGALVFRIVYHCGCVEYVDASGRIMFICEEDYGWVNRPYIFRASNYVLDAAQFDALVQKYLNAE